MARDRQILRCVRVVALVGATALLTAAAVQPAAAEGGDGRWGPGGFARSVADRIAPSRDYDPDTFNPGSLPPRWRGVWELMTPEQRRRALEQLRRDYEETERSNSPFWGSPGGSGRSDSGRDAEPGPAPGGSGSSGPVGGENSRPDTAPDPRDEQRAEQQEMNDRPDTAPDPRDEQRAEQQEMNDRDTAGPDQDTGELCC